MSNPPEIIECKPKKKLTVFGVEFVYLYLFGIIMAFVGWVAENTVKLISSGTIDCRFQLLPFIWVYALIPFAFQIVLGNPDNLTVFGKQVFKRHTVYTKLISNLTTVAVILAAVFVGELLVGGLWEIAFGVKLWDYSQLPLQVTRYAGVIPTLGYGGGAYLIFKFVYTPLIDFFRKKVSHKVALIICCTLGVLIALDTVFMCVHIAVTHRAPMYWSVKFW